MAEKIELQVLEPHKAEGIKELCYRVINNPDTNFSLWGSKNENFGERRETLYGIRKQAERALADLEKETADTLKGKNAKGVTRPIDQKSVILSKLDSIMTVISLLDKYSVKNTKAICKRTQDQFVHLVGHAVVHFPLTFEGEEVVVSCNYYEEISLNNDIFAKYTELEDEEQQINFLKEHVELGNISIITKNEAELLNNFDPASGEEPPRVNPVFANIDEVYQVEVDK